jgi:hypothetical protein
MKICKSCRLDIDEHATKCPNCLTDQRNWFFRHPILSVVSIVFFVSLFINKKPKESKYTQHIPRKSYPQNFLRDNRDVQDDSLNNDVPIEHRNALIKANTYASMMHMSKKSVYNQLVSNYGEKFTVEAAKYAMDHVEADWKENALQKAITYQNSMNMSPASIHNQLVSSYGENFTKDEADYAMKNLNK